MRLHSYSCEDKFVQERGQNTEQICLLCMCYIMQLRVLWIKIFHLQTKKKLKYFSRKGLTKFLSFFQTPCSTPNLKMKNTTMSKPRSENPGYAYWSGKCFKGSLCRHGGSGYVALGNF